MQKITKTKTDGVIDSEEIKSKLYRLGVDEQLIIDTLKVTRVYRREL